MEQEETLGTRFKRLMLMIVILAVIVFVVVVTERLSDDALTLLVGLTAGIAAMTPGLLLMGWLWRRQEMRLQERLSAQPMGVPTSPPVIVVAPPMLPDYNNRRQNSWDTNTLWAAGPAERKFTVVGGEQ
ncbi:MAG: hypothetical protein JW892_09830 [Anaerolineae bacterium]|nr:hypothetical protein [Anaerolineae bacterium]